jgi:AAA15 family ATPase/GTPase
MKAKITRFRIENFRSIDDSGWIESDKVSCLVGTNESGKTNLLIGLWKLNSANNEPIIPLIDYPRKKYHTYEKTNGSEVFASAEYEFIDEIAYKLAITSGWHSSLVKLAIVKKHYNGQFSVEYSQNKLSSIESTTIHSHIEKIINEFKKSDLIQKEEPSTIQHISEFLNDNLGVYNNERRLDSEEIIA